MGNLDQDSIDRIEETIKTAIRRKLEAYKPESDHKPFHARLLGRGRMHLFSFIHSLNTTFGASIYEPVAAAVARKRFKKAEIQAKLPREFNLAGQTEIDAVMNELIATKISPNRELEERRVLESAQMSVKTVSTKLPDVDLWLEGHDGKVVMIEIKTVKPNRGGFTQHKRDLLRWFVAGSLMYPQSAVETKLAFPYNPYHPKAYQRWTMAGLFDQEREVLIAEEFWNYLAGADIHEELLDCFERVGIELRQDIDDYFAGLEIDNRGTN